MADDIDIEQADTTERDAAIQMYADRGMAPKDIGAKFDLSAQQVSAILRKS